MSNATQLTGNSVGSMLREWRTSRGKSQLELSIAARVSSRHLSFVENGESIPSREMVLMLSDALEVPLRERNALLQAAGYAAVYRETPLEGEALSEVRRALSHMLDASEPNPTLVVNRRYDILMANEAALRLVEFFAPVWKGKRNVALMLFEETGLKSAVANWAEVASHVAHRLRSELGPGQSRTTDDEKILVRATQIENDLRHERITATRPPAVLVPIQFRRAGIALDMFTTITTLGTPLDITLHELRIETLFPANEAARNALAEMSRRMNAADDVTP